MILYNTISSTHTDECPYLNKQHSISVNYAEIPIAGQLSNGYKKMNYSCGEISNCPYPSQDKWGRCPVYLSAPSRPK